MSRHKMRKANASLNKGQMVRLVNERVVYVPPILGRCCRFTSAGVLVGCSEVTNEECCCQSDDPNCYTDCDYAEWNQDLNCTDNPCTEDDGACCKDGSCAERTHHQSVRSSTVRLVVLVQSVTHTQIVKIVDRQTNVAQKVDVATVIRVQKTSDNLNA